MVGVVIGHTYPIDYFVAIGIGLPVADESAGQEGDDQATRDAGALHYFAAAARFMVCDES